MKSQIFYGIIIIAIILCTAFLTGCVSVNYGWGSSGKRTIYGKGEIITKDIPVEEFTKVTVRIRSKIYLDTSGDNSGEIKIELYENLAEELDVTVNNGHLFIDSKKNFNKNSRGNGIPKVYLSSAVLEALSIEGIAEFGETDTISCESFSLSVMGVSGSTELDFDVKELNIDISGVGDIVLTGTADKMVINSSGVGSLKAFNLIAKEADVDVSGVGSVEIYCEDKLNAELSGVGGISYKGDPQVNKDKSGLGSIKKVD
jgi:hypothetical protein